MASSTAVQSSPLPPLYAGWIDDLLGGPLPQETRATCSDCAMLPRPGERTSDLQIFFDSRSKCCTYLPDLPNFLVGRVFLDKTPEMARGRATVEQRLANKVAVTPLGIDQPASYLLWYNHSKSGFGRSQTLRCPHYIEDGGLCSIWRHREGTCATWYCKHDRGAAGQRFWRDALHRLLKSVEAALTRWCVLEIGIGNAALERLLSLTDDPENIADGELEHAIKLSEYQAIWGRWAGQEKEFFEECSRRVEGLRWAEVEQACGPKVRMLAQFTRNVYGDLARTSLEPSLRAGSFRLISLQGEVARLSTYNDYDPVDIPVRLLEVLRHFEGQPTTEAIAAIQEREKVTLEPDLIRKLVDFGLLVPANKEPSAEAADAPSAMGKRNSASARKT